MYYLQKIKQIEETYNYGHVNHMLQNGWFILTTYKKSIPRLDCELVYVMAKA